MGNTRRFISSHYAVLLSCTGNSKNHAHESYKAKLTPCLTNVLHIEKPPNLPPTSSTFKTTPIPVRTLASQRDLFPRPLEAVKTRRTSYNTFQKYCHLLEFEELQIEVKLERVGSFSSSPFLTLRFLRRITRVSQKRTMPKQQTFQKKPSIGGHKRRKRSRSKTSRRALRRGRGRK